MVWHKKKALAKGHQYEGGMDRRDFLKGSAAAGGAAILSAALPGAADAKAKSKEETSTDFTTPPVAIPERKIKETLEADVVIVGSGIAGISAARAAGEAGASVIVVEKADTYQYRSGQFGVMESKLQKELGIHIDKHAAVLETMKQTGYRADQRMWNFWADNSGPAFDWLMELAPDAEVIAEDATTYNPDRVTIQPLHYPVPEGYDPSEEYSPTYPTVMCFIPDQGEMMKRVYDRCLEKGTRFLFANWARQLIRTDNEGPVTGVICQDADGVYRKVLASKGVILATGDFAGNKEMVNRYVPWARDFPTIFPNKDAAGTPTNTGDGQLMGIWAGAKLEDGPFAPMTHTLGGVLGVDPFFLSNTHGDRFVNEDVTGQQLSNTISRQPGRFGWQIFDDRWSEQIEQMGVSHGGVNHCVSEEENPKLKGAWMTLGKTAYTSREALQSSKNVVMADTLPELVRKLELDTGSQARLLKSLVRYNELCEKGVDEDFGKTAKRLFPIEKAPFYATKVSGGALLVCMGGLVCDPENGNVLDEDYQPIEGLYAAGNTQGGRFVVDYPVVIAGASHGFALAYGKRVGEAVAAL